MIVDIRRKKKRECLEMEIPLLLPIGSARRIILFVRKLAKMIVQAAELRGATVPKEYIVAFEKLVGKVPKVKLQLQ